MARRAHYFHLIFSLSDFQHCPMNGALSFQTCNLHLFLVNGRNRSRIVFPECGVRNGLLKANASRGTWGALAQPCLWPWTMHFSHVPLAPRTKLSVLSVDRNSPGSESFGRLPSAQPHTKAGPALSLGNRLGLYLLGQASQGAPALVHAVPPHGNFWVLCTVTTFL